MSKNHFKDDIKIKISPYDWWRRDYDYVKNLSPEDREWLTRFTNEYINGRFDLKDENGKKFESLFLNDKRITKKYQEIKKNKEDFEELKNECKKENNKRKRIYQKHKKREYQYFAEFVNTKDLKEKENLIKRYNKIFKTKYDKNTKIKDFKASSEVPNKYKELSIKEYLKKKVYRELNNTYYRKQDVANRFVDFVRKESTLLEYKDIIYKEETEDDLEQYFLKKYNENDLIGFAFDVLSYIADYNNMDKYLDLLQETKSFYETKHLTKSMTFLTYYRVLTVFNMSDIEDYECKLRIKVLKNAFEKIIFPRSEKLRLLVKTEEL